MKNMVIQHNYKEANKLVGKIIYGVVDLPTLI